MAAETVEALAPRVPCGDWPTRDMPAGLTPGERSAYVRGYANGCRTYVKRYGGPAVVHEGAAPAAGTAERRALAAELRAAALVHEEERHPAAARAAMAALRKYRKVHGIVVPAPVRKPRAARKSAAPVESAPVVRLVPALEPVEMPAEDTPDAPAPEDAGRVNRTRKLARRELAAAMRARGENPSDPAAWAAAKLAAGVK